MGGTIRGELLLLSGSLFTGICLMVVYDGLRIFRWLVRHNSVWTGMEDAVYWIGSSLVTFRLLFSQNDGVLRGYAVAGVLGGMCLYNWTGSRFLFALLKKGGGWLKMKRKRFQRRKSGKRGRAERK